MRVFSNLNLNGDAPVRAQPGVGEHGPSRVPSTRWKKWQRVLVPLLLVAVCVAVFFLARSFFLMMTGQ